MLELLLHVKHLLLHVEPLLLHMELSLGEVSVGMYVLHSLYLKEAHNKIVITDLSVKKDSFGAISHMRFLSFLRSLFE